MKLRFYITEYVDGNLQIECNHMHYAFRDDLNYDDFPPERLIGHMRVIDDICRKEGNEAYFIKC